MVPRVYAKCLAGRRDDAKRRILGVTPSGADDIADSRAARIVRARRYPAGMPRSWGTKTDLTRDVRCPYAFWLLDKGLIRFDESISEVQAQQLQGGDEV